MGIMEREGRAGRQPERRPRDQEPQPPPEWPEGTPEIVRELHDKTTAEERLMGSIFGDYPPLAEIQARSVEDVKRMEAEVAQKRRERLASRVGEPVDTTLTEGELQTKHTEMFGRLQEQVEKTLSGLDERERLVLRGRFGLEDGSSRTQAELAEEIGRSPRTVRRIERSALQKLRQPSTQRTLKDFLE